MHYREAYLLQGTGASLRTWTGFVTLSFLCHLVLLGIFILTPGFRPERDTIPNVINVTMVTLAEPASAESPAKTATRTAPPTSGLKPRISAPEKTPPAKKQSKTSLKKKTFKSSKAVKSAMDQLEQTVEDTRPDPLKKALERLKKEVGEAPPPPPAKSAVTPAEKRSGLVGGSGVGNRKVLELLDIYRVEIASRVQKHWAFFSSIAGEQANLVVELAFNVLPDGTITDIWFDRRSGNRYLDDSAERAVRKSDPVGPHPESLSLPYVTVGLRFTPEGVR